MDNFKTGGKKMLYCRCNNNDCAANSRGGSLRRIKAMAGVAMDMLNLIEEENGFDFTANSGAVRYAARSLLILDE